MELMHIVTTADNITLDQLFEIMCLRLGKYSQEIGLVNKSLEPENAATVAMMKFCPHHVSHYLGMDVHDTPTIGRDRNLEPGMVFTVEPGKFRRIQSYFWYSILFYIVRYLCSSQLC